MIYIGAFPFQLRVCGNDFRSDENVEGANSGGVSKMLYRHDYTIVNLTLVLIMQAVLSLRWE